MLDNIERLILRGLLYLITLGCGAVYFPKSVEDARNPSLEKTIQTEAIGIVTVVGLSGLAISARPLSPPRK